MQLLEKFNFIIKDETKAFNYLLFRIKLLDRVNKFKSWVVFIILYL